VEQSDDTAVNPGDPPVFVDDTGRRRARARRVGRMLVVGFVGYLALLAAGFARDPRLGALGLPTFGLPGLVHPQSPPAVLGEAATRPAPDSAGTGGDETPTPASSKATRAIDTARRVTPAGPAGGGGASPTGGGPPTPAPASAAPATGQSAPATTPSTTPTTVPANPGHGSKGSTTTTSTTTTTTPPPTTSTTTPPGQANAASGKGPDGSGPPGQLRRATTSTTAPPAGA